MDPRSNRNTFWAASLVDEFWRAGLRSVCIAPGSRSTPIALAFGSHPGIKSYIHPDERGLGYFALGMALARCEPVALLCTSGTAAANLFPAIVEAYLSQVPLVVLTADRPDALRDSGSNQTIDQVNLYGRYALWSVQVPEPSAKPAAEAVRALRSLACRALAASRGKPAGPVHLNLPFEKPLEPTPVAGDVPLEFWSPEGGFAHARPGEQPFVTITQGRLEPGMTQIDRLLEAVQQARRGLIYCGPGCPGGDFPLALVELAQATGFPVFADGLSGLRFNPLVQAGGWLVSGYETFLNEQAAVHLQPPDLVLQFGALPISKALGDYLGGLGAAQRIFISERGNWADDAFMTSDWIQADPERVCAGLRIRLVETWIPAVDQGWRETVFAADHLAWKVIDDANRYTPVEGSLLNALVIALQAGDVLYLASSLPVRHFDQFTRPLAVDLKVFANRGASGIDGTIASAAGAAAAWPGRRVVLVSGDLAFLHDLNSLLLMRNYAPNLRILLINNDGGGIFHRLPVAGFEEHFRSLFLTPHGLSFEPAARLFGLEYHPISDREVGIREEFPQIIQAALRTDRPQIIEVISDSARHESARRKIVRSFEKRWQTERKNATPNS